MISMSHSSLRNLRFAHPSVIIRGSTPNPGSLSPFPYFGFAKIHGHGCPADAGAGPSHSSRHGRLEAPEATMTHKHVPQNKPSFEP